jgi:hypothetical protein
MIVATNERGAGDGDDASGARRARTSAYPASEGVSTSPLICVRRLESASSCGDGRDRGEVARTAFAVHAGRRVRDGRAIDQVGAEDTAFSERSAPYMVSIAGNWDDPGEDADNIAWVRKAWKAIDRFGTGATYLNFTGRADEPTDVGVDDAFGRNLQRLREAKAKYDPDNFFRRNNNIRPA